MSTPLNSDPSPGDHPLAKPIGFQAAMALASQWLEEWEQDELSDEVLAERVGDLVASRDGARGFFVVAMAGEGPLMDRMPETLIQRLRLAGEGVVDLTARNLAMGTAMAVQHRRNQDGVSAQASQRVSERSRALLRLLEPNLVKLRLESLLAGTRGEGEDVDFLERWGYDAEQRDQIAAAIEAVAEAKT
jgi:hypothetical protein